MQQESTMFDGYAQAYDQWFITNDKVFVSELKLLHRALEGLSGRMLSVGCGSGLFEAALEREYGITGIEGLEPSRDMAEIAKKRGLSVVIGDAQTCELPEEAYDVIYFNGSSTYIKDLHEAYSHIAKALKPGGHLILLDVPSESAYGILYRFAGEMNGYDNPIFQEIAPKLPYPIELVHAGVFHTTPEKEAVVRQVLGSKQVQYWQTLVHDPVYTNDVVEEPIEGYGQGGYVAMIAQKQ